MLYGDLTRGAAVPRSRVGVEKLCNGEASATGIPGKGGGDVIFIVNLTARLWKLRIWFWVDVSSELPDGFVAKT